MPKVNTHESVRVTSKRRRDGGGRKKEKKKDERENENLGMNRILYRCRGHDRRRRRCRRCQRDLHAEMVLLCAQTCWWHVRWRHIRSIAYVGAYCAAVIGHPANTPKSENCFFFFFFFFLCWRVITLFMRTGTYRDSEEKVSRASRCPDGLDLPDTNTSVVVSGGVSQFFLFNFMHATDPFGWTTTNGHRSSYSSRQPTSCYALATYQ